MLFFGLIGVFANLLGVVVSCMNSNWFAAAGWGIATIWSATAVLVASARV